MLFSNDGNALIKNLHQYKEYGSRTLLTEIAEIKWNKLLLVLLTLMFHKVV